MLSLVVLCLYGALFPLVVLWRLNHQYKARWKYEQRQQKRTNSVDPDSASTLPLLDEDLFVWSHEQTNCDPLAFMYVFVRPECYWWTPWMLARRVLIIVVYYWGQQNDENKGFIPLGKGDLCHRGVDWLTVVSALLTMDLLIQQRVKPYLSQVSQY